MGTQRESDSAAAEADETSRQTRLRRAKPRANNWIPAFAEMTTPKCERSGTLRTAECLASCGTAPMMQVDKKYYENLSIAEVDRILDGLS